MHPSSPSHQFKRIIELYNKYVAEDCSHMIPPDITPHDLRHTAASILIANNMDPRSVAGVLGHSNATTTLNIYAYFFRSKNEEAANIMESVLIKAN
uniref:tyrosine-type recombinase/integrase n=1 Tax=Enterocloster clostridioformis TaxID=1531 RepID=UPI0025A4D74F|nr:tyrosine-type recombinase/integrase [Enterocloster clostridioformis]